MPRSVSLARVLIVASLLVPAVAVADTTVFIDPRGGVIEGGTDDAVAGVSWIATAGPGGHAKVPAWSGGARRWGQVVACVQERFADFRVDVVDAPPAGDDHIRIMVGGRPSIVGQGPQLAGIAPFDGSVLRGAVGFVFSAAMSNRVDDTCEAIAHEIGHTLGLEHAMACEDLMSYGQCGEKRFRVEEAACGEVEERACANGEETQSSYRVLARNVGLRGEAGTGTGGEVDEEPEAEPEVEPAPELEKPEDPGMTIGFASDRDVLPGNQWITLTVRAHAGAGLADVVLAWASEDAQYLISCADPPADGPITCEQDGDEFHFKIHAGVGRRAIAAAAIDVNGAQAMTEPRAIWLDGADDE